MIEVTITRDICGDREGRGEVLTTAKRCWRELGWIIFGDGSAVCPPCAEVVGRLS